MVIMVMYVKNYQVAKLCQKLKWLLLLDTMCIITSYLNL